MAFYKKSHVKDPSCCRLVPLIFVLVFAVIFIVFLLTTDSVLYTVPSSLNDESVSKLEDDDDVSVSSKLEVNLPKQNELSMMLEKKNLLPPRNVDLFPKLAKDHITIVLYVHNRPQYLRVVIQSLSMVKGIDETLLIVSHDGYFEEMNKVIEGIRFCQVKQIFAPYSPHLFRDTYPGVSPGDCKDKDDAVKSKCRGNPDQYGNHRSPKIVSLKHHWWWMMNTVWDSLKETREHRGHILFIEEDHFIFPNAYQNIQLLAGLKPKKCPDCYAVNLAPSDVKSKGEGWDCLIAEKIGNVGYAFNRTVWKKIHSKARDFCFFDEYNWDITMWATVYPSFGDTVYTLRGPRASAAHFGKCGLHQGQGDKGACIDNGAVSFEVEDVDKVANIKPQWDVHVIKHQAGYQAGFKGWGGWGDDRDRQLCLDFARMYHIKETISPDLKV